MAGVWSNGAATISGVTDSAGNTYTKVDEPEGVGQHRAQRLERADHRRRRHAADDHRDRDRQRRHRRRRARVRRPVDRVRRRGDRPVQDRDGHLERARASSPPGRPPALTGDNGLAMGFYVDSGFGRTLSADPSYTERVNVSPTSDMEFVVEDALPLRGDTPAARVSTGASTPWLMATVVFKTGVAGRRAARAVGHAGARCRSRRRRAARARRRRRSRSSQRRRRVDELDGVGERELAERVAGERHERAARSR